VLLLAGAVPGLAGGVDEDGEGVEHEVS